MAVRVLAVCTGNICRSPLAEHRLRQHLAGGQFEVASAGLFAQPGQHSPDQTLQIARRLGIETLTEHRARVLRDEDIIAADLVLALDRGHRRNVVERIPVASRYTFTLREFAALAAAVTDADLDVASAGRRNALRAGLAAAISLRGTIPPLDAADDYDVVDPYRRPAEVYERSAEQLLPAADAIAAFFHRVSSRREGRAWLA